MAHSENLGSERIYTVHHRWLSEVLPSGGSLITPGASIWTVERLGELQEHFVDNPDLTKGKTFLEKLHGQLSGASPEAVQLMAELHVVHFLLIWNGAISATKKVRDIETVLSWMPDPPSIPEDLTDAMASGLVHPGQWVLTRRDVQLAWLIRFALAAHAAADASRLVDDPWALRAFTEDLQESGTEGARLGLLHMAHPDTFEAIVSTTHRDLILERFGHHAEQTEDVDRALLQIREELAKEHGETFNFYEEPLLHRWLRGKSWPPFVRWATRFRASPEFDAEERDYKLPVAEAVAEARRALLDDDPAWFGPLKAAVGHKDNNLTVWRTHGVFLKWAESNPQEAEHALRALWGGQAPVRERVDAFLADVPSSTLGPIGERLNIVSFLLMGEDVTRFPPLTISVMRRSWALAGWGDEDKDTPPGAVYERWLAFLDELVRDAADADPPLRDRLDAQAAAWSIVRAKDKPESWSQSDWNDLEAFRARDDDGAGDEGEVEQEAEASADEAEVDRVDHIAEAAKTLHLDRSVLDEVVELLEDKRQVILYGPPGTGKTYLALQLAKAIARGDASRMSVVQFHPATTYEDFIEGLRPRVTDAGQVTYERTNGPLMAIAQAAAADEDHTYVLVIDEINRANLPKVFGELLFLLEYRSESARTLYRPEEPFQLPPNVWFIGTMNTADRSVALIDAAMRRRFHFVPFFPHHGPMRHLLRRWLADGNGRHAVADLLDAVNEELRQLVGDHLLIGPSHFMRTDLSDPALERIWNYNVFPLIEEQLWGDEEEVPRWRWKAVRKRHGGALGGGEPSLMSDDLVDEGGGEPDER